MKGDLLIDHALLIAAADVVLLVVCVAQGTEAVIDAAGDTLLSALKAGGIPSSGGAHSVVGVIQVLLQISAPSFLLQATVWNDAGLG